MSSILVSIISYGERDLRKTVLDCYNKRSGEHQLYFSIVDEQPTESEFSTFDSIDESIITYRKFDWSEYRGIDWARHLTTVVDYEYDYVLFICGHTRFVQNWDVVNFEEYFKAVKKSETGKAILTYCPAEFGVTETNDFEIENVFRNRTKNVFHWPGSLGPPFNPNFVPGYNFPGGRSPKDGDDVEEGAYLHFTWCFGPKQFIDQVPIDPDIAFHVEETYMMIRAWCLGWRFFVTPKLMSWHMSHKKYPDEKHIRIDTHRPWSNQHKEAFWTHVDKSQQKLNLLMSGHLLDKHGGISVYKVMEYFCFSGIPAKYAEYNPDYHKLGVPRHGENLRNLPIIKYEKV
jgi:hypothetical protein